MRTQKTCFLLVMATLLHLYTPPVTLAENQDQGASFLGALPPGEPVTDPKILEQLNAVETVVPGASPTLRGRFISQINSGGYTYIEFKSDKGITWVAIPEIKYINADSIIEFNGARSFADFTSKTLGKTFKEIFFAPGIFVINESTGKRNVPTEIEIDTTKLLSLAKQGDAGAQLQLGLLHADGKKLPKDENEAFKWVKLAADQGNISAQYNLGVMYANGIGVIQNAVEAVKWYLKAAKQGNADAQNNLGNMYANGHGVTKDEAEAVKWYLKGAEQGETFAQFNLGDNYFYGKGVKKDDVEAFKWIKKAADQGYAVAQGYLGSMYTNGKGVKKDDAEAITWYRKGAEQGDAFAQYSLGNMYANGTGVEQNETEALKWYHKAAENGHTEAQYELAMSYTIGLRVEENKVEAEKWFRKAAESGNITAQSIVAETYYEKKDYVAAAKWYRMAADRGDAAAQESIGFMYKIGEGVKQDYKEAEKWFRNAANQGNTTSQLQLGHLYYEGQGINKDFSSAAHWYKKAADNGDAVAQYFLGWMYSQGEGVPKNYSEAIKWYQKSADQGNASAQWSLGFAYYYGEGVPIDKVKALAWYTLASKDKVAPQRDKLEKELKPDEISQAQQLAAKLNSDIETRIKQKYLAKYKKKPSTQSAKTLFPSLIPAPSAKPIFTQNDIAVIIGIEKYRTVPPTEYAAADAGMVRDYLKALGIPDRNIEFLADDRATLSDIRKVIETKLPNMVKANSRVIVYYAGHGAPGTARGESYLVPYDGDPSFLADTAYPLSRLYDRLSRLPAKEVLVILDSCFSGAGGRSVLAKNTRPLVMVKDTPLPASKKMIVLTSSRGSQITTSLTEVGHGAFTYFFLRALQEGNRDIGEVFAYLNPRVTEEAKRQNVDQTPTISPAADKLKGRFLFAR